MNKITEALKLAEEALVEYRDNQYIKAPRKALAATREALADHVEQNLTMVSGHPMGYDQGFVDGVEAQLVEPVKQEPVAYLANGTRFKVTLTDNDCYIKSLPKELGGRWVALIAAEDDCHLNAAPVDVKDIHLSEKTKDQIWLENEVAIKTDPLYLVGRAEALEEAAEQCDRIASNGSFDAEDCAEAIRGMK